MKILEITKGTAPNVIRLDACYCMYHGLCLRRNQQAAAKQPLWQKETKEEYNNNININMESSK